MYKTILKEIEDELIILENDLMAAVDTNISIINQPLKDVIGSGGKRLRPAMVLVSARFGDYNFNKIKMLAVLMELLHTATLIHDDIIDDSPIRRGIPSLHKSLGKDVAVLAGDYLFCKVFKSFSSPNFSPMLPKVSETMCRICEGELKQREDLFNTNITLEKYLHRIRNKTATLFALSFELGATFSKVPKTVIKALYNYGINIGIAFQIVDDIRDFSYNGEQFDKPSGLDFRCGIITLPTIHALKDPVYGNYIKKILNKKELNYDEVNKAIEIIKKAGGINYARLIAKKYALKSISSLNSLPEDPMKDFLIKASNLFVRKTCAGP